MREVFGEYQPESLVKEAELPRDRDRPRPRGRGLVRAQPPRRELGDDARRRHVAAPSSADGVAQQSAIGVHVLPPGDSPGRYHADPTRRASSCSRASASSSSRARSGGCASGTSSTARPGRRTSWSGRARSRARSSWSARARRAADRLPRRPGGGEARRLGRGARRLLARGLRRPRPHGHRVRAPWPPVRVIARRHCGFDAPLLPGWSTSRARIQPARNRTTSDLGGRLPAPAVERRPPPACRAEAPGALDESGGEHGRGRMPPPGTTSRACSAQTVARGPGRAGCCRRRGADGPERRGSSPGAVQAGRPSTSTPSSRRRRGSAVRAAQARARPAAIRRPGPRVGAGVAAGELGQGVSRSGSGPAGPSQSSVSA